MGRIVRSEDFVRVLGTTSRVRSSHFAVHHLAACPSRAGKVLRTGNSKLSTGDAQMLHSPVDETLQEDCWLGVVVPKRHAKRSVTRSLLKRQIRAAFADQAHLPPGMWVVRLRSPFDRKLFPSAASDALRLAAHGELAHLVGRVRVRASA